MNNCCMPKEQRDKINRIKKEMLERTNMTENEAYLFAFNCYSCGLDFTKEFEKENQELKEIIKANFFYHEYSEEIGYKRPMPKYQDKIKEVLE